MAGAQQRRAQILFGFLMETDKTQHRQIAPVIAMQLKNDNCCAGSLVGSR
jgi:hypothetical protein